MKRRQTLLAAAAGLLAGPAAARTLNGFDLRDALVPADAIAAGGPPRDGIPAIDHPRFVPTARAPWLDGDRVLGIVVGGEARAYPVRILNWHEVVNDRIAGQPVAITYCPLCGTGVAFDARVPGQGDGRPARFGVSGLLYNSDVLLYDRGTESLWSQIMGQAISGPLKGTPLVSLPLTHTTWAAWRQRHPQGQVLSTETGFQRDYGRDPYAGYENVSRLMFDVQHRDERLPPKAWVLGLRHGDQARAWPLDALATRADADGRWRDRVGTLEVEIRYDPDHRTAEAFTPTGQPLPAMMAFWFAWVAFHPTTTVLTPP